MEAISFDDNLVEKKNMVASGEDKMLQINSIDMYTAIEELGHMIEEERIIEVCTKYKFMVKNVKPMATRLLDDVVHGTKM